MHSQLSGIRIAITLGLTMLAGAMFLCTPGCDSYFERRELERERNQLQARQAQLEASLRKATGGKTEFTDEEKALIGPIAIALRKVENRLEEVKARLRELN